MKVRRKDASALRCLTVKDIFEALNEEIEELCETHSLWLFDEDINVVAGRGEYTAEDELVR